LSAALNDFAIAIRMPRTLTERHRALPVYRQTGSRNDDAFQQQEALVTALLIVSLLIGVSAAYSQADQVPLPKPKPKPEVNSLQKSPTGSRLAVPIPVAKPGMLENLQRGVVSLAVVPNDQYAACLQDLEANGAEFERPFHVGGGLHSRGERWS